MDPSGQVCVVSLPQSLYRIIIFYACHDMGKDGKISRFSKFLLVFFVHLFYTGMRKLILEYSSWFLLNDLMGKYFSLNVIDQDFQFNGK